jgi:hypothetical protein
MLAAVRCKCDRGSGGVIQRFHDASLSDARHFDVLRVHRRQNNLAGFVEGAHVCPAGRCASQQVKKPGRASQIRLRDPTAKTQ